MVTRLNSNQCSVTLGAILHLNYMIRPELQPLRWFIITCKCSHSPNYEIRYIIVVCGRNAYGKQMKIDWGLGPHSIRSGNHQTPFTFWTSFCLRAHAKWNLIRLTASSKFVATPYLTFSNPTNLSYVLQSFTLIDKRDLLAAAYARAAWLWLRLIQVARCLCVCVSVNWCGCQGDVVA